jgi:16S rRNA (guanine527-N7)-methyltransferase
LVLSESSPEELSVPYTAPFPTTSASPEDVQQLLLAVATHQLSVTNEQAARLAHYCCLLWDWNSRLNLTRHTDWDLFVTRDLLDTIELSRHILRGFTVMDVGSGGGVPGIVLAILRPDLKIALCESIGKKAVALQAIVKALRLPVVVHADRAEVVLKKHRFQVVTVRAVGSISKLLTWFGPVLKSVGRLLLIKGPRWKEELEEAESAGLLDRLKLETISEWSTPGRDGQSVLLHISK